MISCSVCLSLIRLSHRYWQTSYPHRLSATQEKSGGIRLCASPKDDKRTCRLFVCIFRFVLSVKHASCEYCFLKSSMWLHEGMNPGLPTAKHTL